MTLFFSMCSTPSYTEIQLALHGARLFNGENDPVPSSWSTFLISYANVSWRTSLLSTYFTGRVLWSMNYPCNFWQISPPRLPLRTCPSPLLLFPLGFQQLISITYSLQFPDPLTFMIISDLSFAIVFPIDSQ